MRVFRFALILVWLAAAGAEAADGPSVAHFAIAAREQIPLYSGAGQGGSVQNRVGQYEVLRVLEATRGYAGRQRVLTADGRTGWVRGIDLQAFDPHGIYLADLVRRRIRLIPGLPADLTPTRLDDRRTAFLENHGGRIFVHDRTTDRVETLFAGVPLSIGNRILLVSPGGRFLVFRLGGPDGETPDVHLLDCQTRDCLLLPTIGEIPLHFSTDGQTVLWGPDPLDGQIYRLSAATLIRDLANLRGRAGEFRHVAAAGDVDLAPDGRHFLVRSHGGRLRVYRTADFSQRLEAESVSTARFLPDGLLLVRRPIGWLRLTLAGELAGGPFRPDGGDEFCRISPGGRYALFLSRWQGRERLRALWDLSGGRTIAPIDENGEPLPLIDPRFCWNDMYLVGRDHCLRPQSGVARTADWLAGFVPEHFSSRAGLLLRSDVHGWRTVDAENGRRLAELPFPAGFSPFFPGDPALCYFLREYRR